MKALGEAAVDLPWILPYASSLVGLTRPDFAAVWSEARFDPGCVLLLARAAPDSANPFHHPEIPVLEKALIWLAEGPSHFVDWSQPGADLIYDICVRQAVLAYDIATRVDCCPDKAFAAGLLAPLGWLAVAATQPQNLLQLIEQTQPSPTQQQQVWGLDHTTIVRRLGRLWRLPSWLAAILGNLGFHVSIAAKLGADPTLFRVVQLAVASIQEDGNGLHLPLGDDRNNLLQDLGLSEATLAGRSSDGLNADNRPASPVKNWETPAQHPYLVDLLRLAIDNRRQAESAWADQLQTEIEQLQKALADHCQGEKERLQTMKLAALAELAAGAGHEINNPLAVISGQAQYLLKQLQLAEDTLAEETAPTALLQSLKAKLTKPLQTIIGQTQRIHSVLTDLIHFARPPQPHRQLVPAGVLLREVRQSLQEIANQKQVRLECAEPPQHWGLDVDVAQVHSALGSILRNAIEAAPLEGWAGLRVENGDGTLKLIVEDNGPGPSPGSMEHLFDPFYSGRSAGRGRGFGLASAWRLARQHGGDVRFAGRHHDVTRFILSLPATDIPTLPAISADETVSLDSPLVA